MFKWDEVEKQDNTFILCPTVPSPISNKWCNTNIQQHITQWTQKSAWSLCSFLTALISSELFTFHLLNSSVMLLSADQRSQLFSFWALRRKLWLVQRHALQRSRPTVSDWLSEAETQAATLRRGAWPVKWWSTVYYQRQTISDILSQQRSVLALSAINKRLIQRVIYPHTWPGLNQQTAENNMRPISALRSNSRRKLQECFQLDL